MTSEVRSEQVDAAMHLAEDVDDFLIEADQELLRIRRIGRRLFGVANCIATFGEASRYLAEDERSLASIEAAFCLSIPQQGSTVFVSDAQIDQSLSRHRLVTDAPFIRFYMSHPIFNQNQVAVGDASFNLTISLGVASTEQFPAATTDDLINRTDIALYVAKDAGRNCVVPATPG
jgi:GAF domain-containing protein